MRRLTPTAFLAAFPKATFAPKSRQKLKSALDTCVGQSRKVSMGTSARTFFITGATDGIGRHTAMKLACDGHRVLVHGRKSPESDVVRDLLAEMRSRGAHSTKYLQANLLDLQEVSQLAEDVQKETQKLDVLINNAGEFDPDEKASAQGYDATWAVNVLAPFKLTMLLLPVIAKGTDPRIITTSSISQSTSLPSVLENIGVVGGPYSRPHPAYSLSKLGDHLFTVGLADRLRASSDPKLAGIKCLTMDPGTVNTKMHFAAWGWCGIPPNKADKTYTLAASNVDHLESGSYSFGGTGSRDASRPEQVNTLWNLLEKQTGLVYSEEDTGA